MIALERWRFFLLATLAMVGISALIEAAVRPLIPRGHIVGALVLGLARSPLHPRLSPTGARLAELF